MIEMHHAAAELVVAKWLQGQRAQARPLPGEHRRDLALGGAVDAGVGPAGVPAMTCCFFASLKRFPWRRRDPGPRRRVNVSSAYHLWTVFRCPAVARFGCPLRRLLFGVAECVQKLDANASPGGHLRRAELQSGRCAG